MNKNNAKHIFFQVKNYNWGFTENYKQSVAYSFLRILKGNSKDKFLLEFERLLANKISEAGGMGPVLDCLLQSEGDEFRSYAHAIVAGILASNAEG